MSERITLAQLAAISMLTERTLRSYLKRGLLAGEKTPGGWRFTAEQTAAFLALPQVCSASNARRNAVAEDFIQRRMDTTGQLCAVLDLPVAAAELCRTVAALRWRACRLRPAKVPMPAVRSGCCSGRTCAAGPMTAVRGCCGGRQRRAC